MGYLGVYKESMTEKVIEKSRFLSYVARTEGEEEARAFLDRVRSEHKTATHVCYGYVADSVGNLLRYSDDGEPQGTAGLPILGVVRAKNLFCTAVAVVRYFGGIKLGAGGLTRAYCGSAQDALSSADIREYAPCIDVSLTVAYPEVNAAMSFLERKGYAEYGKEFGENAVFTVSVREERVEEFCAGALEFLNGRAELKKGERKIFPFAV